MKESTLQRKILKALNSGGWGFFVNIHGGPYQRVGLPDIIGCGRSGTFIGLEVKLPGEPHPVTPMQQKVLDEIRVNSGIARVVHSVEEAIDAARDSLH